MYGADLEAAVKNFQAHHRLTDDGVIGRGTIEALNVTADARTMQLRVNLERARWVVGGLRDSFVLVNLPAFKAYVIRDRKNVWETRTQIGREARKTPTFRADLKYLVLNPDWTVPPTILAQDVLAGMKKGQNTIAKKKLTILDDRGRPVDPAAIDWQAATPRTFRYTLRQPPGADNALGRVKFIFPNEYLDLPARHTEPGALRRRPAHLQLGVHPRRQRARPGAGAARGAADATRWLERGADRRVHRRRPAADRQLRGAAPGADRVLDGVDWRRRRPQVRQGRLRPRRPRAAGAERAPLTTRVSRPAIRVPPSAFHHHDV